MASLHSFSQGIHGSSIIGLMWDCRAFETSSQTHHGQVGLKDSDGKGKEKI